jgi:hypothetical protein
MKPAETNSEYLQQSELWRQVRACIKGKYAVNEIVDLLPGPQYSSVAIYNGMTDEQLNAARRVEAQNNMRVLSYWSRGRFFNATSRTYESLGGLIWAKEPEKEIPKALEVLESGDSKGCSLREVAQCATDEVIAIGRYGVLVDMPKPPTSENGEPRRLTKADNESGEFAPRLIPYLAEQIVFAVEGEEIHLTECKKERNGDKWEDKKYIRKLIMIKGIYHNQLWNDKKEMVSDVTPYADGEKLAFIPFQFFGSDQNTAEFSKVPLYDLANMNLGHYALDCDNRDNLHFHGQGMVNVYTAMTPDEFYSMNPNGLNVGAKGMNQLKEGDKVEISQIDATGAIPAEMERDQQRMIYLGAQLVQDNNPNQTLGAKEIDSNASMSTLKRISRNVSKGMEQCIKWAGMFLGINEEVTYKLNTEFVTDTMDPQTLAQHFQAVQGGLMPKVTYYDSARKAGLTELDNEEIEELAEQDNLEVEVTDENTAQLQAQLDAALEEIEELKNA